MVGRDLIVRSVAFQIAFLSAAGVAARMGTAQIAAHQIGLQLWEFTALLLDSFAIAAQSLVGAALGGADADGARRMAWQVSRWGLYAGVVFGALFAAGWVLDPARLHLVDAVLHQAHVLWPWFVGMLPAAGIVFALDGVLIGAGDVGFMRTLTVVAGVFAFAPLNLAALHWHWGIGGVWAGLTAFIVVRFVGMVVRARGKRWLVLGESGERSRRSSDSEVTDGLVIVDKPAGLTSHDVVGRLRRLAAHPQGRPRRHARPDGHRRPGARRRQGDPAAAPPRAGRQGVHGDDPARAGHRDRRRRG